MKSTGPILMLLSYSEGIKFYKLFEMFFPTHDGLFAKEDVDNSNILVPCVVELILVV